MRSSKHEVIAARVCRVLRERDRSAVFHRLFAMCMLSSVLLGLAKAGGCHLPGPGARVGAIEGLDTLEEPSDGAYPLFSRCVCDIRWSCSFINRVFSEGSQLSWNAFFRKPELVTQEIQVPGSASGGRKHDRC